jgi:hypothetical protein
MEVVPILQIVIGAVIFRTLSRLGDSLLRAKDAVFKGSWIKAVYLIIMTAGIFFTVDYGMNMVAASIVFTTFIHSLMSLHLCRQLIGVTWSQQISALVPSLILGIVSTIAAFGASFISAQLHLPAIISIALGAVCVLSALLLIVWFRPQVLGHRHINILFYLPEKIKSLRFMQPLVQRVNEHVK